jgi:hypothetical protein
LNRGLTGLEQARNKFEIAQSASHPEHPRPPSGAYLKSVKLALGALRTLEPLIEKQLD